MGEDYEPFMQAQLGWRYAQPVVLDALTYDADPAWWEAHAMIAGVALIVQRGPGRGFTEQQPDGGYGYVCTRRDLAGAEQGRW